MLLLLCLPLLLFRLSFFRCLILVLSLMLVFSYRDPMGGPGSERDNQLTLRSGRGDEQLIGAGEKQFLASNRWVRWYRHLTYHLVAERGYKSVIMAGNVFKNPPSFISDGNYESWKKDIAIWCKLTDIAKEKQVLVIHLVLTGKARQASSEVEISDLEKPDGVEYLIRKLDQLFLMDESRRQFRAFQELYNLRRTVDSDVGGVREQV